MRISPFYLFSIVFLLIQDVSTLPLNYLQKSAILAEVPRPITSSEDAERPFLALLSKLSPFQLGKVLSHDKNNRWFSSVFQDDNSEQVITEGVKSKVESSNTEFEMWLGEQKDRAFERILENIGGSRCQDKGVAPGAVLASPSKIRPNYFYQWVRDAAITVNSLVEYLDDHLFEDPVMYNLQATIEAYIINSYKLQRLANPSGGFKTLAGLGEPKFMPDSTPFNGPWGRPQRDGPGLRVITIANYIDILDKYQKNFTTPELLSQGSQFVFDNIIKPDLSYIIKYWSSTGFDLWEEVDSIHLFTSLTQLKALKIGLNLAGRFGDSELHKKLVIAFNSLRFFISVDSGFKPSRIPYLIETPSLVIQGRRSGLDIASVLASLRAHDIDDSEDTVYIPFPITDAAVMNTLIALMDDMKYRYPINHELLGISSGYALGRYPEDIYDGYGISEGNPWFISTATASELIYKLVYNLYKLRKGLEIQPEQSQLFAYISSLPTSAKMIHIPYNSQAFKAVTASLIDYADTFLAIIRKHVDAEGHMSEQFNKYSGYLEGAEDLTWSYGSFWSSLRWRSKALELMSS